jgi:hypothetical protein
MPKKAGTDKNKVLSFSLPAGAMMLLQELIDRQEVGGDRAEVIRHLVVMGLQHYVDRKRIGRDKASTPEKSDDA